MKTLIIFILLASASFASGLSDAVNAMNYPLCRVMVPHRTYAGVLVDAKDVQVTSGPKGLVGGLTLGLANFAFGTSLGSKHIVVHQYVIRLDQPENRQAELITLVQGGGPLVPSGTPVFLSTLAAYDGSVFSVQMIACSEPEAYGTTGLEEARLARRATSPRARDP